MYGLDHQNESVKYIFQPPLFHQDSVVILRQINYTLEKHRISYLTLFRKHTVRLKNSMDEFSWKANVINELIYVKDCSIDLILSRDEYDFIVDLLCND